MPGDNVNVGSVSVEVVASARGFARSLKREVTNAFRGIGKDLQKTIDRDLGKRGVRIPVEADDKQAAGAGVKASQVAQKAAPPVKLKTDIDRKQLRKVLAGALAGAKVTGLVVVGLPAVAALVQGLSALLAGLASAAAGAIPIINSLASALVTAAGAAVAIPGAIAIAGAAFATLKIGLSGVGDALKAIGEDAAAFEEAIKDLAPSAQQFARAVRGLRDEFRDLRLDVQQELFAGLGDGVDRLARVHLPALQAGLPAIAEGLNSIARRAIQALSADQTVADLPIVLHNTRNAVFDLARAVNPLVFILRDLAVVGSSVVQSLTEGFGDMARGWAQRIAEMRQSGELRDIMLDGIETLKLFGAALVDIGGIIKGVFGAAGQAEGGGIFGLLDRLNAFVNQGDTQASLRAFFAEMGRIGDALMPVLSALLSGLGAVSRAIGDIAVGTAPHLAEFLILLGDALARLAPGFIALGPAVVALGQALGPLATILADLVVGIAPGVETLLLGLADGLALLAPAAKPVGEALGAILAALAPLLPLLGATLANTLINFSTALSAIAQFLTPILAIVAEIGTELYTRFAPIFQTLADQILPVFAAAGQRVADALAPLLPVIVELAQHIAGQLAAALPQLVDAFVLLFEAITDHETGLLQAMVDAFIQLVPHLPTLVDAGLQLALALADLFTQLVPLIPMISKLLLLVLQLATPGALLTLTTLIRIAAVSMGVMRTVLQTLAAPLIAVTGAIGALVGWLRSIDWAGIGSAIGGAFAAAWLAVSTFFTNLFQWVAALPGRVLGFLAALPGQVAAVFTTMFNRVLYAVGFGIGTVLKFFIELPGKIGAALAKLPGQVATLFTTTWNRARAAVSAGVAVVVQFFRGLPGKAAAALASLWSRISGALNAAVQNSITAAGRLVSGFISVVRTLPGKAQSEAAKVRGRIASAFGGAATWLYQAGRNILTGLANGIRGAIGAAVDAAVSAARSVVDGVRDGLGIGSPSKVFRDQVGRWIPEGIAEGIRRNAAAPQLAVDDLASRFAARMDPFDLAGTFATPTDPLDLAGPGAMDQGSLARLVAREVGLALDGARLVIDDRGMGRLEARQADYIRRAG